MSSYNNAMYNLLDTISFINKCKKIEEEKDKEIHKLKFQLIQQEIKQKQKQMKTDRQSHRLKLQLVFAEMRENKLILEKKKIIEQANKEIKKADREIEMANIIISKLTTPHTLYYIEKDEYSYNYLKNPYYYITYK